MIAIVNAKSVNGSHVLWHEIYGQFNEEIVYNLHLIT